jgi:hypothetical protein
MLESSSVLSRWHTTCSRSADASVNWMNFSAGLRIVYHFSPELTLASGASTTPAGQPRWGPRPALGSVRAQASLNQTDPLPTGVEVSDSMLLRGTLWLRPAPEGSCSNVLQFFPLRTSFALPAGGHICARQYHDKQYCHLSNFDFTGSGCERQCLTLAASR